MESIRLKEIRKLLREINLFRSLDDDGLDSLAKEVGVLSLDSGAVFLKENEIANSMYLILDGAIEIYSHSEEGKEVNSLFQKKAVEEDISTEDIECSICLGNNKDEKRQQVIPLVCCLTSET
mgnify:CR=1 FL=1